MEIFIEVNQIDQEPFMGTIRMRIRKYKEYWINTIRSLIFLYK